MSTTTTGAQRIPTEGVQGDISAYARQGFGTQLPLKAPFGLLIIDFVNGFADPAVFGGGNIPDAIAQTRELLAHARAQGWPVAHSRIVFSDDDADSNIFCLKVPGMLTLKEDSPNSAIVSELAPAAGEYVVRKSTPSAFFGTMLAPWLAQRGVQTLLVAGCVTSGCVRASVVDAMQAGFRPLVVSDCCGDRAIGPHEANLFDMAQKYAAVMPMQDAFAATAARPRQAFRRPCAVPAACPALTASRTGRSGPAALVTGWACAARPDRDAALAAHFPARADGPCRHDPATAQIPA